MGEENTVRPGLLGALRRLAVTFLAILQNRLELLAVELQDERARLFNALLLAAAVVALGFVTLALAVFALGVMVWDEYGVKGLFGLSGACLAATLIAYGWLRWRLKNWPFLSATVAELKKDRALLEERK